MTPVELLARLAALIAPPRYPLVRYHGVLAPHAKLRAAVVPQSQPKAHAHAQEAPSHRGAAPTEPAPTKRPLAARGHGSANRNGAAAREGAPPPPPRPAVSPSPPRPPAVSGQLPFVAVAERLPAAIADHDVVVTDLGLSVRHMDRLLGGLLLATSPRVPWAKLLRRTYEFDVLACSGCGGRLRLLSAITNTATARQILEHLGMPADPITPRARSPDEELLYGAAAP